MSQGLVIEHHGGLPCVRTLGAAPGSSSDEKWAGKACVALVIACVRSRLDTNVACDGVKRAERTLAESGAAPVDVLLRSLRLRHDEVQLTRCLANLAEVDRGVGEGLVRALLSAASSDPVAEYRAARLLRSDLLVSGSWETEVQALGDRRRRRRARHGRLDWLMRVRDGEDGPLRFVLGIEVKINDETLNNPLEVYYEQLAREGAPEWGLMLLARNRPPGWKVLDANLHENWLGVALWWDVIQALHEAQPADEHLGRVWPSFLRVVSADDDLGAAPITIEDLTGKPLRSRLTILAEHSRDAVQKAAKAALDDRHLGKRADPRHLRVTSRPSRGSRDVGLRLFVAHDPDDPAVEFALKVVDGVVHLTSRVHPAKFWLAPKKSQHQREATARLTRLVPTFDEDDRGVLVRDRTVNGVEGDLREPVAHTMIDEIRQIIATGILDYDL